MNEAQKEKLGVVIDQIDNLSFALLLPIPDKMHVEQLRNILPEVVKSLKSQYVEITGENLWSETEPENEG